MSKKKIKNRQENIQEEAISENGFSEKTEKIFKKFLRIMSWTVGVCFVLILFLPFFNDPAVDRITKYLFNTGLITLIVKKLIEKRAENN